MEDINFIDLFKQKSENILELLEEMKNMIIQEKENFERRREIVGNALNENLNQLIDLTGNENCYRGDFIKTPAYDAQMKENELLKRTGLTQNFLSKEGTLTLEKEIGRLFDRTIFDSQLHDWSKGNNLFYLRMLKQSNVIFFIETTDGRKFGCYISKEILEEGKLTEDPNSFLFKIENGNVEKFPMNENKKAIEIFGKDNDKLFKIGKNAIRVTKNEFRDQCRYLLKPFHYEKSENVFIQKPVDFEMKRFIVVGTVQEEKYQERKNYMENEMNNLNNIYFEEMRQLEEWTKHECESILFDSNFDN